MADGGRRPDQRLARGAGQRPGRGLGADHRRIAYQGDWTRAVRRGAWVALVVGLLVALRTQHAFSAPVALFVVVMVVFVEASLTVQR